MRIEVDGREVKQLEVDISGAPWRVQFNASKTLRLGARLVDDEMREDARGHRYLPRLQDAVSHELLDPLTAEIGLGPKRGTGGSLAHIIVYGSVNNGPVYDHLAGPRRAMPAVGALFEDVVEDSVLGDQA